MKKTMSSDQEVQCFNITVITILAVGCITWFFVFVWTAIVLHIHLNRKEREIKSASSQTEPYTFEMTIVTHPDSSIGMV